MRGLAALVMMISVFGAFPSLAGDMSRWEDVLGRMHAQHAAIEACRADNSRCVPEAELALSILAANQVAAVNRAVNRIVRPKNERIDVWADPFATLNQRQGDCEDYAILKFFLLREMGYAPVLLIVGRGGQHHMVVSIRVAADNWIVLDNLTNAIVPFAEYAMIWKVEKALG